MKKQTKTIQHGKESESYHCRQCNFSGTEENGCLARAKRHNARTGHTIDVYYESWREITNNWH